MNSDEAKNLLKKKTTKFHINEESFRNPPSSGGLLVYEDDQSYQHNFESYLIDMLSKVNPVGDSTGSNFDVKQFLEQRIKVI